jgi:hypothetical protein
MRLAQVANQDARLFQDVKLFSEETEQRLSREVKEW